MMDGIVSDIQKFSMHDGNGIRTTVFLKGCSLHCAWCHNPESIPFACTRYFDAKKCIGCLECIGACAHGALKIWRYKRDYDKRLCKNCDACVDACAPGALYIVGKKMSAREVFEIVASDKPYYDASGGGVTLSGGEPTAQPEFAAELLAYCREAGIHTAMESCMYTDGKIIEPLLALTDTLFCDIKLIDEEAHTRYTGASNRTILRNIRDAATRGGEVVIRTPLIPGITDTGENIAGIARWIVENTDVRRYELLNYNPLAQAKWENIGLAYSPGTLDPLPVEALAALADIGTREGLQTIYEKE